MAATLQVLKPVAPVVVSLDDRAVRTRELFQTMEASAHQMGVCAILIGMEFIEAKKALGETRGGDRKSAASPARSDQTSSAWTFDQWLETHFPDLSRTRAYDFIRVARESKAGLLKSGSEAITSLLLLAPSQLSPEQRAMLHKEVKGFAGERDLNQLLLDFGLVKKGRKTGKGTGDNGADTKALKADEPPFGRDPAEWAIYVAADEQERSAIDTWRDIYTKVAPELDAGSIVHLPEFYRAELANAVELLRAKLAEVQSPKPRNGRKGK